MTPSDTERLAREADVQTGVDGLFIGTREGLQAFADLVLELAAKKLDKRAKTTGTIGRSMEAMDCAAAVRAMKGKA